MKLALGITPPNPEKSNANNWCLPDATFLGHLAGTGFSPALECAVSTGIFSGMGAMPVGL